MNLTEMLREEIRREGPISFRRFMEAALYDPAYGYYRQERDPFGKRGDFYTAEQIQPVFGILMAVHIRSLWRSMGAPSDFTVVEAGAGRGEMAPFFREWRYVPVDLREGAAQGMPEQFCGVLFANEFFDALPVEVVRFRQGVFEEMRVDWHECFGWVSGPPAREELREYLRRYFPPAAEGQIYEINLEALAWMDRIAKALAAGYVLAIDYGYTRAESIRFPRGSLMGYRRHRAVEDVLNDPGSMDITAHVAFTALAEYAETRGLRRVSLETLAQTLLAVGESDSFAAVLEGLTADEERRRRLQLKNLLFGMGETFRTLRLKAGGDGPK